MRFSPFSSRGVALAVTLCSASSFAQGAAPAKSRGAPAPAPPTTSAPPTPAPPAATAPSATTAPPPAPPGAVAPAPTAPPATAAPPGATAPPATAAPPAAAPPYYPPQGYPPPGVPPQGYVPVVIQGKSGSVPISLSYEKRSGSIIACADDCTVYLPPREYWLTAQETSDTVRGMRSVTVSGPSRILVEPRNKSDRSTGLLMGIAGIGLVVVGSVAMLSGLAQSYEHDINGGGDDGRTLLLAGLVGFTAGAVLTPIGWVKFGRSAPSVEVRSLSAAPR